MGLEIEHRFIVKREDWKQHIKLVQEFQQCYLSTNFAEWIIRMRIIDTKKAEITLKAFAKLNTNYEFTYSIPLKDAQIIWNKASKKICKKRYHLNLEQEGWVVDCFEGENYPLVLAEVELISENDFVEKPNWCGDEITGLKEWSNAALASNPISAWSLKKRKNFNLD